MNETIKMCRDCNEKPRVKSGKKWVGRCKECHREWKRKSMSKLRAEKARKKAGVIENGRKVCSKCLQSKLLSEYSFKKNKTHNTYNKLCDACLLRIYVSDSRLSCGFDAIFWREKAYQVNTTHRATIARRLGVNPSTIGLKDLEYVCKGPDLAEIHANQNGLCAYCCIELTPSTTAAEHKDPRSKYGDLNLGNLCLSCRDCNRLKYTRTDPEFRAFLKVYADRLSSRSAG